MTTAALLRAMVRGAQEAGFTGLMVVLARNADAPAQLRELAREWPSLHDVTGHLIAVLSPDPRVRVPPVTSAFMSSKLVHRCAAMHDLNLVSFGNRDSEFTECFVASARTGRGLAVPPYPPKEHRTAWTEAASRCASYFGITEAQIPAVLMVSFAERTAVLVRLRPRSQLSLYDLCKQIAENLGYTLRRAVLQGDLEALRRQQRELHRHRDALGAPGVAYHARERWRAQLACRLGSRMPPRLRALYDSLDQHLASVAEVDPALVGRWRARLAELLSDGTAEETYRHLFAIRLHVTSDQDRPRWRGLASKLGKVVAATDREILGKRVYWDLDQADPLSAMTKPQKAEAARIVAVERRRARETAQIDAALNTVTAKLANVETELASIKAGLEAEPGLAAATESAARQLLGQTETHTLQGTAGLAGCTVRVVQPVDVGEVPPASTGNTVSGTVSGILIQARDITGDIRIHPPNSWKRGWRRFS